MKIHAKLVSFISAALVVPILLGLFYLRYFGELYYQQQQGTIYRMMAEELAGTLEDGVSYEFQKILNWAAVSPLAPLAEAATDSAPNMDKVARIDAGWSASSRLQREILAGPVSRFLTAFQQINPELAEMLMTDRYGRLIGATNPTTDYWQADEGWWTAAAALPPGGGIIQGLLYDESAHVLAIDMAFPVYSADRPDFLFGVLKVSLYATRFLLRAAPRPWNQDVSRDLFFPDGRLFARLNSADSPELFEVPAEMLERLAASPEHWRAVEFKPGEVLLAAAVPVNLAGASTAGPGPEGIDRLYVVVSRDLTEAMMPVQKILRQLTLWGIVSALLIALIAYLLVSCWFARPIKKLRRASRSFVDYIKLSEQGRFEESWDSRQNVRSRMNELETIRGRDELQGLAGDFLRMGERMLSFLRQLEEKLPGGRRE